MRSMLTSTILFVTTASLTAACTSPEDRHDDLAGEADASETNDAKADAAGTTGYYSLEVVQAHGATGNVNHFLARRANAAMTTCAPGVKAAECELDTLDLSNIVFPSTEERSLRLFLNGQAETGVVALMVRGRIADGAFKATEVWRQDADLAGAPDHGLEGVAVRLEDSGLRCVSAPCPNTREAKLNSTKTQTIHGVTSEDDVLDEKVLSEVFGGGRVIVIGALRERSVQLTHGTQTARIRSAGAVFFRVGS